MIAMADLSASPNVFRGLKGFDGKFELNKTPIKKLAIYIGGPIVAAAVIASGAWSFLNQPELWQAVKLSGSPPYCTSGGTYHGLITSEGVSDTADTKFVDANKQAEEIDSTVLSYFNVTDSSGRLCKFVALPTQTAALLLHKTIEINLDIGQIRTQVSGETGPWQQAAVADPNQLYP